MEDAHYSVMPLQRNHKNPAEGVWALLKNDLGNLAACTVDVLAELTRTRLKQMPYRAGSLDGLFA